MKILDCAALSLLFLLSSCEHFDGRLNIVNQSEKPICIATSEDTLPVSPAGKFEAYLNRAILPGDTAEQSIMGKDAWMRKIRNSTNGRLNVFIYAADSVRAYHNMDSLNRNKCYRRLSLSPQELQATKWRVVVR